MDWKNRSYAETLTKKSINKQVGLYGWVDTIRDHGNLLFIHLRDNTGIIQIVFNPETNKKAYEIAQSLHSEYVIEIKGKVSEREEDTKNPNIPSGEIEIIVDDCKILAFSKTLPFIVTEKDINIDDHKILAKQVDEDTRLKYRYLDLRKPSIQKNFLARSKIYQIARNHLIKKKFIEIETPILTKSTPEGARDYLVPSRIHKHNFYALPQSPQLFKQMLMSAGFDRYFQIARCFRDEDLRPNRQPEFTQLDIEASFIDEEFIYELTESLIYQIFKEFEINFTPFIKLNFDTALNKYGNDHPDLRFGLEFVEATEIFINTDYKILKSIASNGGNIKGINIKGKANQLSKNILQNEYALNLIPKLGGKGLTWMKMIDGKLESNIVQFLSEQEQKIIIDKMNAENGDVIIFIADYDKNIVNEVLGKFRLFLGESLELINKNIYQPLWITNFPLLDEKDGKLVTVHHPFTQSAKDISNLSQKEDFLNLKSRAYDIVINGEEIGGGSIRIHKFEDQIKIFKLLGLSDEEIEEKFGFFIECLKFGTPPHGGIALGLDRLVAMICKTDSIREVIAFPKNRVAHCPLTKAPSNISDKHLQELHLAKITQDKNI